MATWVSVNQSLCRGCGACAAACPRGAIRVQGVAMVDTERCNGCGLCLDACPTGALFAVEEAEAQPSPAVQKPGREPGEVVVAVPRAGKLLAAAGAFAGLMLQQALPRLLERLVYGGGPGRAVPTGGTQGACRGRRFRFRGGRGGTM
jgi:NAD-dependent dihydropyrimidine dehydrogenase PreA subunit